MDTAKYRFVGYVKQVGNPKICELLIKRNLINRYRIEQYLCLSDMQPFVIQFDFYRPDKIWVIQGFNFENKIDNYIEESITIEIGKKSIVDNEANK